MRKESLNGRIEIMILILVAILGTAFTIADTGSLKRIINEQSMKYVNDINIELGNSINETIERVCVELESMTFGLNSYVTNYSGEEQIQKIEYFLDNREELLEYESMVFIMNDHRIFNNRYNIDLLNLDVVKAAFEGNEGVLAQDDYIIYAIPVFGLSGEINGVLVGINNAGTVQEMIKPNALDADGISLILDRNINIVVEPMNGQYLETLRNFFYDNLDKAKRKYETNGYKLVDFKGEEYILSYTKLDRFGWTCITLVPYDFISKTTDRVENRLITSTVVTSCILISMILFYLYKSRKNMLALNALAYKDAVTGGMNINAFKEHLQKELHAENDSIILVNIKNFKLCNVDLGKCGGDALLKAIYDIIHAAIAGRGYVTRYYADIFYIYFRTEEQSEVLDFIARINRKIKAVADAYLKANDIRMEFIVNYGISTINKDKQMQLAFDEARMACRERLANEDGIPKFYTEDIHKKLERKQILLSSFRDAIANKEFKIYLQAKVNPYNRMIYGGEVLVRWIHPVYGFIPPNDFIPLLESNGYISALDFYMFEETCRGMRRAMDNGTKLSPVSINLSGEHFKDAEFPDKYYAIAQKYEIPTKYLELELTETFFIQPDSIEIMHTTIGKLHEYGFKVAMDDFGSGISTLSMLGTLDIDILKIDKSLIDNANNVKMHPILKSISEIAHKLNIVTVVEGVEDSEQLEVVKEDKFDYVQGYIYSKPMPALEFVEWAKNYE